MNTRIPSHHAKKLLLITTGGLVLFLAQCAAPRPPVAVERPANEFVSRYQAASGRIIAAALADSSAFDRLAYLCDMFGPRLSGSENLELTLDWAEREMQADGLEAVHSEEVMVPHWVRGNESLEMLQPRQAALALLGLGGSIATPSEGITAPALVVGSFEELSARAGEAAGKIVVFNVPFVSYGTTVKYRSRGAIAAGEAGAVAALLRSVGPVSLNTPHTGAMHYREDVPRIPFAAITIEAAEMLQRLQDRGVTVELRLKMEAATLPDAPSRNVMAELRGTEFPDEIVVMGGHIDSWDVGQGAMDDGSGCVAAWQALRLLKDLGLRPRRTIRVVLWTNEENGLRGGNAYYDAHRAERHVLAMESDEGTFQPLGFTCTGSDTTLAWLQPIGALLEPLGAGTIRKGGGGVDILPLTEAGVPGLGLEVDGSKYFWYHHTHADMLDKLDPRELNLCVAALAVMAYVVADFPQPPPR